MADRIAVVDKSRISEHGTHEELIKKNGKYCEMYTIQASAYK